MTNSIVISNEKENIPDIGYRGFSLHLMGWEPRFTYIFIDGVRYILSRKNKGKVFRLKRVINH